MTRQITSESRTVVSIKRDLACYPPRDDTVGVLRPPCSYGGRSTSSVPASSLKTMMGGEGNFVRDGTGEGRRGRRVPLETTRIRPPAAGGGTTDDSTLSTTNVPLPCCITHSYLVVCRWVGWGKRDNDSTVQIQNFIYICAEGKHLF